MRVEDFRNKIKDLKICRSESKDENLNECETVVNNSKNNLRR